MKNSGVKSLRVQGLVGNSMVQSRVGALLRYWQQMWRLGLIQVGMGQIFTTGFIVLVATHLLKYLKLQFLAMFKTWQRVDQDYKN